MLRFIFSKLKEQKKYTHIFAGIILLASVPFLTYVVLPKYLEIPTNADITLHIDSVESLYNTDTETFDNGKRYLTTFLYQAIKGDRRNLQIQATAESKSLIGEPISTISTLYEVDLRTGKNIVADEATQKSGYVFAPRITGILGQIKDTASFEYVAVKYDTTATMNYVAEEVLYGLPVYHYETVFLVDQTKDQIGILPGVGIDKGIVSDVHIELWVEPYTGQIVQYHDTTESYYYDLKTKERLYPWKTSNSITDYASVAQQIDLVALLKQKTLFILFFVGGILLLSSIGSFMFPFLRKLSLNILSQSTGITKDLIVPTVASGLVLVFTISLTYVALVITKQQIDADFEAEARVSSTDISNRVYLFSSLLRGARGLFDASDEVSRNEWALYVESLNLRNDFPGIMALGFAKVVSSEDKKAFIEGIQEEGFPDFDIVPEGERNEYVPVTFVEPVEARNKLSLGFDIFSDITEKETMEFSRDSGNIVVSGKLMALQENTDGMQTGFVMYEPVYKSHTVPSEVENREKDIQGYVYGVFHINDFMLGIFSEAKTRLGIEIFDGENTTSESNLVYKNNKVIENAFFSDIQTVSFYNHTWTIRYTAPDSYEHDFLRSSISKIVFIAGILLSILVFFVMYVINTRRSKAISIAQSMTQNLKKEKIRSDSILKRLTLATRSAKIGVWDWDIVKNVLTWDDQMYSLYGINKRDFGGAYEAWQKGLHPEDRKLGDDAIQMALSGEKDFDITFRVVFPDGKIKYLKASAEVERTASGKPLKMVGVNFDVTQEKEVDKAKSEFVSLASHQLKTPLTSINWYTEILMGKKHDNLTEKQKTYVAEIHDASVRMSELVNSLLNVSRLELGTFAIEPEMSDVMKVIQEVVKDQSIGFTTKKQKFSLLGETSVPQMLIDKKLLHIIVQNLLSNASKYSPDNSAIDLRLQITEKKSLRMTCSDNGYGIPKKQQDQIFKKLFRADNIQTLDVEGTGLGLYIVKTIAETAGCTISFESEEGKGTTFIFEIPATGMKPKAGSRKISQKV